MILAGRLRLELNPITYHDPRRVSFGFAAEYRA